MYGDDDDDDDEVGGKDEDVGAGALEREILLMSIELQLVTG